MHKFFNTYLIVSVLFFTCFSFIGCNRDPRVPVSGQITLNGEPLEGAAVDFLPMTEGITTRAGANTNAKGEFQIAKAKGLLPGEYSVSIYSAISFDPKTKERATHETNPDSMIMRVLTPPEYNDQTEQRFTVSPKGKNHYTCDVKSNASQRFDGK